MQGNLSRQLLVAIALAVPPYLGIAQTPRTLTIRVPFVGCKSDGQVGPLPAPKGAQRRVAAVSANDARRLAYYQAQNGFGVLAPRGWHCFSTYGSSGSNLFVAPEPLSSKTLLSSEWKGFSGSVIQISVAFGGTSGRFEVAEIIARDFPKHLSFTNSVIAEGIESAQDFPRGAYPGDKLTYRNDETVEYVTPPRTKGLGTDSYLLPNSEPISGVAVLFSKEPNLLQLSIRMPLADRDLTRTIIAQAESEASVAP